jgi:hypothetical protein
MGTAYHPIIQAHNKTISLKSSYGAFSSIEMHRCFKILQCNCIALVHPSTISLSSSQPGNMFAWMQPLFPLIHRTVPFFFSSDERIRPRAIIRSDSDVTYPPI